MEWIIGELHQGMMIREYLSQIHALSRRLIIAIKFDGGAILVNGKPETVRYQLVQGDLLTIHFPPEKKGFYMVPEELPLSIFYEDDAFIIINKPAGIATTPSPLHQSGTIANGLLAYYKKKQIPNTVHVVTRLDRDTSGLLLVAKDRYNHSLLAASQQQGFIKRKYQAIVDGQVTEKTGTIDAPIGRKENSIIEREVVSTGRRAVTHYEVKVATADYTLLDLELETGRTHQIRVHLAYLGYPLTGDDLYGGCRNAINRQALHCSELQFPHPSTKEYVSYRLPLAKDMNELINKR